MPVGEGTDDSPDLERHTIEIAYAAMVEQDLDRLRLLLHPYLHWTRPDGSLVRGRTKVLAMLDSLDPPARPAAYELRDDQIYRWTEPPSSAVR